MWCVSDVWYVRYREMCVVKCDVGCEVTFEVLCEVTCDAGRDVGCDVVCRDIRHMCAYCDI